MRLKISLIIIVIFAFSSCNPENSEEQRLSEKAYEKQKTAISLMSQLEKRLQSSIHPNKDSLYQVIKELEESLFTIPGYELDITGHEGHNHSHSNIALSAEEIYKVQEDLLKQLNQVKNTLDNP